MYESERLLKVKKKLQEVRNALSLVEPAQVLSRSSFIDVEVFPGWVVSIQEMHEPAQFVHVGPLFRSGFVLHKDDYRIVVLMPHLPLLSCETDRNVP